MPKIRERFPKGIIAFQPPTDEVGEIGQEEVNHIITDIYRMGGDRYGTIEVPVEVGWQWKVNGKAEYVGTFPKRLSKWMWQQYGIKLTAEQLGRIGTIAAQHSARAEVVYMDFNWDLDWLKEDGVAFDDSESCFRDPDQYQHSPYWITGNGGGAVRFYSDADGCNGIGRALLLPWKGETGWVMFNVYGFEPLTVARILSLYWHEDYKRVKLEIYPSDAVYVNFKTYIRGDRHDLCIKYGYVFAAPEHLANLDRVCIDLDEPDDDPRNTNCDSCGCIIRRGNQYRNPNGDDLCHDCYGDQISCCTECGNDYYTDDMREYNNAYVCERCVGRYYDECIYCEQLVRRDHSYDVEGGACCESCAEDHPACCNCGSRQDGDLSEEGRCDACQEAHDKDVGRTTDAANQMESPI